MTDKKGKTALVAGATGATGSALMKLLIAAPDYAKIHVVARRATHFAGEAKVAEHVLDFEDLATLEFAGPVDDVFCCLGTTRKQAGSLKAFRRVDLDYVAALADLAVLHGAETFALVSSMGADRRSWNSYLKTKGEAEQAVRKSGVPSVTLLRPSLLLGERSESRPNEALGEIALGLLKPALIGPLRPYRAIKVDTVARAMLATARSAAAGVTVLTSDRIAALGHVTDA